MASDAVERLLAAVDHLSVTMVELDEDDHGFWCTACGYTRADREALVAPDAHADHCPWRQLREAAAAVRASEARDVWLLMPYWGGGCLWGRKPPETLCEKHGVTRYRAYPIADEGPPS